MAVPGHGVEATDDHGPGELEATLAEARQLAVESRQLAERLAFLLDVAENRGRLAVPSSSDTGSVSRASALHGSVDDPDHRSAPMTAEVEGAPTRESHCSCGRPAAQVLDGGKWGPTGYCGAPFKPLDPCDCSRAWLSAHSRNVCHIYGIGMEER